MMVEEIKSVKVWIKVETNKRTLKGRVESLSLSDAAEHAKQTLEDMADDIYG